MKAIVRFDFLISLFVHRAISLNQLKILFLPAYFLFTRPAILEDYYYLPS